MLHINAGSSGGDVRAKRGLFRFRVLKGARKKFICLLLLLLWLLSIAFGSWFSIFGGGEVRGES